MSTANLAAESSRTNAVSRPTSPFPALRRRVDSARRAVRLFFDATIGAAIAFIFALFGIESFEIGARGATSSCARTDATKFMTLTRFARAL
jgi:hypothetical protein